VSVGVSEVGREVGVGVGFADGFHVGNLVGGGVSHQIIPAWLCPQS